MSAQAVRGDGLMVGLEDGGSLSQPQWFSGHGGEGLTADSMILEVICDLNDLFCRALPRVARMDGGRPVPGDTQG